MPAKIPAMTRRRNKGKAIHGWLVIDKPLGMSSAKAVAEVKRLTGAAKAGHGGTLDPLASGVLPIALGEATKTTAWAMAGTKTYEFTVRWGQATDSDDAEGDVVAESGVRPDETSILAVLSDFVGDIEQLPPIYSALKVDGRRAYQRAREGEDVKLEPRTVRIDRLSLTSLPDADHAAFEVTCGKGTYVRSIARDLAEKLGTYGHISSLRRTAVGGLEINSAIALDNAGDLSHSAPLEKYLLPLETVLDDIPALDLTVPQATRLRHGQRITIPGISQGPCLAMNDGKPVALAEAIDDEVSPVRVFNL